MVSSCCKTSTLLLCKLNTTLIHAIRDLVDLTFTASGEEDPVQRTAWLCSSTLLLAAPVMHLHVPVLILDNQCTAPMPGRQAHNKGANAAPAACCVNMLLSKATLLR